MFLQTLTRTTVSLVRTSTRSFKTHILNHDNMSRGRSVVVNNNNGVAQAYAKLRDILNESKVRETVRYQQYFERKHDLKRRKKNEALFRHYLVFMQKNIKRANDLKKKNQIEQNNYEPI